MLVYHGSDTLPKGRKPTKSEKNIGVYMAIDEMFAREFGMIIHCFEIDEESIFDYRLQAHRELAEKHCPSLVSQLSFNNNLPKAWGHSDGVLESLNALYEICQVLGFSAAYEDENFNGHISIEVWQTSCLKPVKSYDWAKRR